MFPEWHHAVPESAYFKVPETLKTFRMYPTSRFVYVLHWLAARLLGPTVWKYSPCRPVTHVRQEVVGLGHIRVNPSGDEGVLEI